LVNITTTALQSAAGGVAAALEPAAPIKHGGDACAFWALNISSGRGVTHWRLAFWRSALEDVPGALETMVIYVLYVI
jgi:hypothetical protein